MRFVTVIEFREFIIITTVLSFTWNDFVQFSLRMFGGLSNGTITAFLITLSVLMALLLVFFALELAKDKANPPKEAQDEEQEQSRFSQEQENSDVNSQRVEVLPVYTIQSYEIVDEDVGDCPSQPQTEELLQELAQQSEVIRSESQPQQQDDSTTQALKKGIATLMPVEDETGEMGVRYDRSFTAKLIQSDDQVKEWYSEIKNHLLSYKRVRARTSWGRESFRIGKDCFARLVIKGKTLCILLAIIPISCNDTKYKIEDLADLPSCKDTPCLYRIKSNRRVIYAKELKDIILEEYDAQLAKNREAVDYYMPYEGTLDLIKRGLIKRRIVAKNKDFLTIINSPSDGDGGIGAA